MERILRRLGTAAAVGYLARSYARKNPVTMNQSTHLVLAGAGIVASEYGGSGFMRSAGLAAVAACAEEAFYVVKEMIR